jgi:hypothetical protein
VREPPIRISRRYEQAIPSWWILNQTVMRSPDPSAACHGVPEHERRTSLTPRTVARIAGIEAGMTALALLRKFRR